MTRYLPMLQNLLAKQREGGFNDYEYAKILKVNQTSIWRAREKHMMGASLAYRFVTAYPEFAETLRKIEE